MRKKLTFLGSGRRKPPIVGWKIRCPRCKCFVLMNNEIPVSLELLPIPNNGCNLNPVCACHAEGSGLVPRFEVIQLPESIEDHAKRYRNIKVVKL